MKWTLQNLLLATPCFGVALFVLAKHIQFVEAVIEARARGQFVCGTCALGIGPGIFLTFAGLAALCGYRLLAAVIGIPMLLWVAAWNSAIVMPARRGQFSTD